MKKELNGIVDKEEIKQLQEWTSLKCGEVVFDSEKDDWDNISLRRQDF